jgi:hypothetical protein
VTLPTIADLFAEDLLWHNPGRNQLAGDYLGRDAVHGLFGRLTELTEGCCSASGLRAGRRDLRSCRGVVI